MINWFTVAAQIINFLILVGLLKHFLYGPIIKAMDEREASISKRLEEAEKKRDEADQKVADYEEKAKQIEQKKKAMLDEAREAAEKERKERVGKAREEADALSQKWHEAVEREKDSFLSDIRQCLSRNAVSVARKALADLADARVEDLIIDKFIHQLEDISDEDRKALKKAIESQDGEVTVQTGLELSKDKRKTLTKALGEHIGTDASFAFNNTEAIVAGIELSAGGKKVAWTLAHYLDTATAEIRDALEAAGAKQSDNDNSEKEEQEQERDQDAEDDRS